MANGSVATIVYSSVGDTKFPKEYIEVFSGGKVGIILDFKTVDLWSHGKRRRLRWSTQNKGQKSQIEAWVTGLKTGRSPIPFDEIVNVHKACFAAFDSLRTGETVKL